MPGPASICSAAASTVLRAAARSSALPCGVITIRPNAPPSASERDARRGPPAEQVQAAGSRTARCGFVHGSLPHAPACLARERLLQLPSLVPCGRTLETLARDQIQRAGGAEQLGGGLLDHVTRLLRGSAPLEKMAQACQAGDLLASLLRLRDSPGQRCVRTFQPVGHLAALDHITADHEPGYQDGDEPEHARDEHV